MELRDYDIRAFFDEANALVGAATRVDLELAERIGIRFNVFDFIRPNENRVSDILRDLLDPRGSHGQGPRFLEAFLATCGIAKPQCDLASAHVSRESPTSTLQIERRIDLVIDFVGTSCPAIGIENKPWANEQVMQLADYAEHLQRRYEGRFHLIYLSGDGSRPTTLAAHEELQAQGKFHLIPYNSIGKPGTLRRWIKQCVYLASAEKVRWFLRDFAEWIERNFDPIDGLELNHLP